MLPLNEHWVFLFLCSRQDRNILISLLKMVLNSGITEISIVYLKNIVSLIHKKFLRGRWSHNLKEEKPQGTELFVLLVRF